MRRRLVRHAPAALVVAALAAVPLVVTNNYYLDSIIVCFFWGSMAAAWNLVGGYAGQLSLGHTAFFGIGAYASSILFARYALTPWLGLLVGAALAPFCRVRRARLLPAPGAVLRARHHRVRRGGAHCRLEPAGPHKGTEGFNIPFRPAFENMLFRGKVGYFYLFLGTRCCST
jgi:branched-chain amino acid transport system permease protein